MKRVALLALTLTIAAVAFGGTAMAEGTCPVDQSMCMTAANVQTWVTNGDVPALVAGSTFDTANDRALVTTSLGALKGHGSSPAAVAIGCAAPGGGAADCTDAFSIAIAASPITADSNLFIFGFSRSGPQPVLTGLGKVNTSTDRAAVLQGGVAAGCGLSGLIPKTETDCIPTRFAVLSAPPPSAPNTGSGVATPESSGFWPGAAAGALILAAVGAVGGMAFRKRHFDYKGPRCR